MYKYRSVVEILDAMKNIDLSVNICNPARTRDSSLVQQRTNSQTPESET